MNIGQAAHLGGCHLDYEPDRHARKTAKRSEWFRHYQPDRAWSGVYYVDAGASSSDCPLSGVLEFLDPRPGAEAVTAPGDPYGAPVRVKPESGLLVIFPSWLYHWVHPYSGGTPRIAVSQCQQSVITRTARAFAFSRGSPRALGSRLIRGVSGEANGFGSEAPVYEPPGACALPPRPFVPYAPQPPNDNPDFSDGDASASQVRPINLPQPNERDGNVHTAIFRIQRPDAVGCSASSQANKARLARQGSSEGEPFFRN